MYLTWFHVAVSSRGRSPPVPAVRHRVQGQQASPSLPPPVLDFIPYVRTDEVFNLDPLEPADTPPPHTGQSLKTLSLSLVSSPLYLSPPLPLFPVLAFSLHCCLYPPTALPSVLALSLSPVLAFSPYLSLPTVLSFSPSLLLSLPLSPYCCLPCACFLSLPHWPSL